MGLLPEGDAIVTVDGVPNIVTSYGECNLSLATSKIIFRSKFGLSEKHSKFEKIFPMVLTNQLI